MVKIRTDKNGFLEVLDSIEPAETALTAMRVLIRLATTTKADALGETAEKCIKEMDIEKEPLPIRYKFFRKLMCSKRPSKVFYLLRDNKLLDKLMPELIPAVGCMQNTKYHKDDVFTHCVKACDMAEPVFEIRAAALLHDIGKPYVKTSKYYTKCNDCGREYKVGGAKEASNYKQMRDSGAVSMLCGDCGSDKLTLQEDRQKFFKHEVKSDSLAKVILKRFGVPKRTGLYIAKLVRNHMYLYDREWTDKAMKRFVVKTNMTTKDTENIERFPLFLLREADRKSRGLEARTNKQKDFENRLIKFIKKEG